MNTLLTAMLVVVTNFMFAQNPVNQGVASLKSKIKVPALSPLKDQISLLRNFFKPGIKFNGLSAEGTIFHSSGFQDNDSFQLKGLTQYFFRQTAGIGIAGIPFRGEFVYRQGEPSFINTLPPVWYSVTFDVDQYREQWKKIASMLSPEQITESGKQFRQMAGDFRDNLKHYYKGKIQETSKTILDSLTDGINPADLAGKSPEELSNYLFGADIKTLIDNAKARLRETAMQTMEQAQKDSTVQAIEKKIHELEDKQKYIDQVSALIKSAKLNGSIDSMKELFENAQEEYRTLLSNPQELARKLAAKFDLGGIEKLFSLLSQLKLGGQQLPFITQSAAPFLSKGISFEINIKDKYLGFSTGRLFPVDQSLLLNGYDSLRNQQALASGRPSFWSLEFRKGRLSETHKGIRLTSVKTDGGASLAQLQPAGFTKKSTLLINLYSRERLFANNWLIAELSKSVSIQPNQSVFDFNSGRMLNKSNSYLNLNNVLLKIRTEGNIEKIGLTHQTYFNKIIGAYANFSNSYPSADGYEAGFSARIRQKTKKLSANIRGSVRKYGIPGNTESRWKSSSLSMRTMYKLKNGQYIQLGYNIQSGYKKYLLSNGMQTVQQQSRGITADAMLVNKRILGLYNTSFVSAGIRRDVFPLTGVPGKDRMNTDAVTILLNQTFLYKEHLLQLNVNYTHVSQEFEMLLYNTRLDANMGGNFRLTDKLTAGIAGVFGYLKGAYTNAGVKVSLSGNVLKRLELDFNADIRKNIKLQNPLFDQFFMINGGLKYTIKK